MASGAGEERIGEGEGAMAERFRVTKDLDFCYGHRLLRYEGKCRHPHGHNARVEVDLEAARLDERGMVVDFDEIKAALQTWIDQELDHRMILHREDSLVAVLREMGEPLHVLDENPTAEAMARMLWEQAHRLGFPVREVRFWETTRAYASYRRDEPAAGDGGP